MEHRRVWIILLGLVCVFGTSASSQRSPFDPYLFVYFNELIFDGKVLSDQELPLTDGISGDPREPGWYYPTNIARIEVSKVFSQRRGKRFTVGDTISFKFPTGNCSYNPDKPGLVGLSSGFNGPLGLKVGEEGLFGLTYHPSGEFRKGYYFALDDSMESQVRIVLKSLEADSLGTVDEIKRHYNRDRNWKW